MNVKDNIYEIKRNKVKEELTNHLGRVLENPDKLICYVKKSILKSKEINEILCYGINLNNVELANDYNLNKPIWYVFDGIEIYNYLFKIGGCYNPTIIINNSNLANEVLYIRTDGKLIIDDSTLIGNSNFLLLAKDLELNRCFIKHTDNQDITYGIYSENSIKIKDSVVGNSKVNLSFETPNLTLIDNVIEGKKVYINKVRHLICDDENAITALESANIEANAINQIDVDAPNINVNGKEYKSRFIRKEYKEEIGQKRCELLDVLAKIRDKYSAKLKNHQDSLYSKPLTRKLRK